MTYILIRIYLRPQHKSGWLGRRVCLSDDETVARNVKGADSEIITGEVKAQTNYVKALHGRACHGHHWVSIATSFHIRRSWSWGWLPWGGGGGQADREVDQEELLELPTLWIAPAPMEHLLRTNGIILDVKLNWGWKDLCGLPQQWLIRMPIIVLSKVD